MKEIKQLGEYPRLPISEARVKLNSIDKRLQNEGAIVVVRHSVPVFAMVDRELWGRIHGRIEWATAMAKGDSQ